MQDLFPLASTEALGYLNVVAACAVFLFNCAPYSINTFDCNCYYCWATFAVIVTEKKTLLMELTLPPLYSAVRWYLVPKYSLKFFCTLSASWLILKVTKRNRVKVLSG